MSGPASAEAPPGRRERAAIGAVLAAVVLAVLDAAIANVALPTMAQALRATPGAAVSIVTGYQTALVMGLLPCAALGDSRGHRRVFMAGIAVFTGASLLCALAPTLAWLLAARFVQGLGAAAILSLGVALLRRVVPPRRLGAALGWNALAVALASAAGPTLGAAVLSVAGWPWLFALNLPLGLAVLLACRALPKAGGSAQPFDGISAALNAATFAALVIGAELLTSSPALAGLLLAAAAVAGAALLRRERTRPLPLVPLDLLRERAFRLSVIASVCCFAGITTALLTLPFLLQHELGQSALTTGLFMTPWPLAVAVAAPLAGRLAGRLPTAWLCAAGGLCLATGLTLASAWPLSGTPWPLVAFTLLCGAGFGLFQVPNNRQMLLATPSHRSGAAAGMQATARLAGQTAGGVIASALFALASAAAAPRLGLLAGAALTLLAGAVSLLRARPAARPRHTPPARSRAASGAPGRPPAADATAATR